MTVMRARTRPTIGVIGHGALGRSLCRLFPDALPYDSPLGIGDAEQVREADFAFVAVPTLEGEDGACDTRTVDEVVSWLRAGTTIVCSTVAVGSIDRLVAETGRRIVYAPQFGPGSTPDHPYADPSRIGWVILGGERPATRLVADLYKTVYGAGVVIQQTDARTAELVKYMENCFLATKVAFCNEFYDIAEQLGVDYNEMRELWLLDPRIGRSHTLVHPEARGFGGPCLPKDVAAALHIAEQAGVDATVLQAVVRYNRRLTGAA